ncbi:MAG: hypothetical protein H7Y36_03670, partial [Armatimonadetes bacterium]|nr:hypothetical protein [Akkermansiaceae bacterium]
HPDIPIAAYDLAPRPKGLPDNIVWIQGDLLTQPPPDKNGILIANLFLHHFEKPELIALAHWLANFQTLIINEPLRARLPLFLGKMLYPFIHPVTRHDMRVSIEAGFIHGELPNLLGLDTNSHSIQEESTFRGSIRIIAKRKDLPSEAI